MLLNADLSVSHCHEVSHNVHQASIVSIRQIVGKTLGCVMDKRPQLPHAVEQRRTGNLNASGIDKLFEIPNTFYFMAYSTSINQVQYLMR